MRRMNQRKFKKTRAREPVPGETQEGTGLTREPSSTTASINPPRTPKSADRPHRLTLLLSLTAIVVSTLSFIQSLRTQKLTERLSRAEVRIQKAECLLPERLNTQYEVNLGFVNLGKTTATNLEVRLKAAKAKKRFRESSDHLPSPRKVGDLGPGQGYTVGVLVAELLNAEDLELLRKQDAKIFLVGQYRYKDSLTGEEFQDAFCYMYPIINNTSGATMGLCGSDW